MIQMCKIEKRKTDREECEHVLIKVEICNKFREKLKKNDPDRQYSCSEEFSDMKEWEDRIENGSWYRRITACSNYSQEDHKRWRLDKERCNKWGQGKGGPCEKKEWNKHLVVTKYFDPNPSGKPKLKERFLKGKSSK